MTMPVLCLAVDVVSIVTPPYLHADHLEGATLLSN